MSEEAVMEAISNDRLRRVLKLIIRREKELREKYPDKPSWWMWKISEIGASWNSIQKLMELGIVENVYSSSRNKYFRLTNYELVVQQLKRYEELHKARTVRRLGCNPVPSRPDDLFDVVVGYEDYKWLLWKALKKWSEGSKPAHFLLVGPPASGKTLFLECIERKMGCVEYVAGEAARRGGFSDRLYKAYQTYGRRFILLLDEIDKMDFDAIKLLYNLMEGRFDLAVKGKMISDREVAVMVFATANQLRYIPSSVISRFGKPLMFKEYDKESYIKVVERVLPVLEGTPTDLAKYIALKTAERGVRDPRVARQIARIVDSREDVDRLVEIMLKGGTPIKLV